MLKVEGLETSYGQSQVLFGVGFEVNRGEVVTLIGRNGMGKTTTVRSIMGLTPPQGGSISFEGKAVMGLAPFRIARLGLGLVPEGRGIFANLTVWENLTATAAPGRAARWTPDSVTALFPWLAERRNQLGQHLSGGEQQMLAIARALMTNPSVLLLDEPMEGLAPVIVRAVVKVIAELVRTGEFAVVIVEQHARLALSLTKQAVVLDRGKVVHNAASADLLADSAALDKLVALA